MGKYGKYLAMSTDMTSDTELVGSDLNDLGSAARNLAKHAFHLSAGLGLGFGSAFLQWLASCAAIYLLVLDRTNWKTNMLTSLLIPYIYLSLPYIIFNLFAGDIGKWIAFIAVVLRLFFPHRFPDWLELPGSLILLLVVAPYFFAHTVRDTVIGMFVCLAIGCYLLQEHIRASGGFRNSFTKTHGVSNSVGIILLLVYPVWRLIVWFL
ncbi:hypothetical protein LUZ60_010419 [Juncus effusus]|nr:hypothetical protein LUZ60_010419 [Juncus effusus]